MRTSLTSTVLTLKSLGINDVLHFDFIESPKIEQLQESLLQLFYIGAVSHSGDITRLGKELSRFPLEPRYSKALLYAHELERTIGRKKAKYSVESDVLKLVSVLST